MALCCSKQKRIRHESARNHYTFVLRCTQFTGRVMHPRGVLEAGPPASARHRANVRQRETVRERFAIVAKSRRHPRFEKGREPSSAEDLRAAARFGSIASNAARDLVVCSRIRPRFRKCVNRIAKPAAGERIPVPGTDACRRFRAYRRLRDAGNKVSQGNVPAFQAGRGSKRSMAAATAAWGP
jgi:hypothetical protein